MVIVPWSQGQSQKRHVVLNTDLHACVLSVLLL